MRKHIIRRLLQRFLPLGARRLPVVQRETGQRQRVARIDVARTPCHNGGEGVARLRVLAAARARQTLIEQAMMLVEQLYIAAQRRLATTASLMPRVILCAA